MKKVFFLFGLVLVLVSMEFVLSHSDETFAQAEEIIKQKILCNELGEEQLEILGEYYMEQMHPGELHERMDAMMGGEGSESLRQMHINMGKRFYCEEKRGTSFGNNAVMGNMMMGNMMYGGMIGAPLYINNLIGFNIFGLIISILIIIVLTLLIMWLVKQLQKPKNRRKN